MFSKYCMNISISAFFPVGHYIDCLNILSCVKNIVHTLQLKFMTGLRR